MTTQGFPASPSASPRTEFITRFRPLAAALVALVGIGVGLGVGLGLPPDESISSCSKVAQIASSVVGWTYFAAWSVSFYPQVLLNIQRRSVVGLSLDYTALNVCGFACYSAFNVALYFVDGVRTEYADANGSKPIVRSSDVFFALHALLLSSIVYLQSHVYPRGGQKVSLWVQLALVAVGVMVLVALPVLGTGACHGWALPAIARGTSTGCTWLNFLTALSLVKLAITLTKYVPQVVLNIRRKSTVGWVIDNVILDMTGGLLSLVQELMDAGCSGDWSAILGDPTKFGLGLTSIVFDAIFLVQHFVLYADARRTHTAWQAADGYTAEEGGGASVITVEDEADRRAPLLLNAAGVCSPGSPQTSATQVTSHAGTVRSTGR